MLEHWPDSWAGEGRDLPLGRELVACMRPFIEFLFAQGYTKRTLRRHLDALWMLGGEIVRQCNLEDGLRRQPPCELLRDAVDSIGGPLLGSTFSEEEQEPFDTTCRKLNAFFGM